MSFDIQYVWTVNDYYRVIAGGNEYDQAVAQANAVNAQQAAEEGMRPVPIVVESVVRGETVWVYRDTDNLKLPCYFPQLTDHCTTHDSPLFDEDTHPWRCEKVEEGIASGVR